MNHHIETIGQKLLESTFQVFAESGVKLDETGRCEPVGDWLDPIAVIGFGGDTARGSVSFEMPWRVLQASHPSKSGATDDLVDWAGELSNLVLGTLKRKLRSSGVSIQLGLPSTFTTRTTQAAGTGSSLLQYRLRSMDGSVIVRFSAEVDEAFDMAMSRRGEVVHEIELF